MMVKLKWSRRKSKWAIYHQSSVADNCLGYAYKVYLSQARMERYLTFGQLEDVDGIEYTQVGYYQLRPYIENHI